MTPAMATAAGTDRVMGMAKKLRTVPLERQGEVDLLVETFARQLEHLLEDARAFARAELVAEMRAFAEAHPVLVRQAAKSVPYDQRKWRAQTWGGRVPVQRAAKPVRRRKAKVVVHRVKEDRPALVVVAGHPHDVPPPDYTGPSASGLGARQWLPPGDAPAKRGTPEYAARVAAGVRAYWDRRRAEKARDVGGKLDDAGDLAGNPVDNAILAMAAAEVESDDDVGALRAHDAAQIDAPKPALVMVPVDPPRAVVVTTDGTRWGKVALLQEMSEDGEFATVRLARGRNRSYSPKPRRVLKREIIRDATDREAVLGHVP